MVAPSFRRVTGDISGILVKETGSTVIKALCYKSEGAGSIPGDVIHIKSFRSHYGSGVDSASKRNEYQEYFLGVHKADNLTTILCRCHEIWEP